MKGKDRRLAELKAIIPEVTPAQALNMQAQGAALIDVRETDEIAQGSPVGAYRLGRGFLELRIRNYAEGTDSLAVPYVEGWYVDPEYRLRGVGASLIRQASHPRAGITGTPADHCGTRHPEPVGDLGVGDPIGGEQHDPGPLRQTRSDRGRPRPGLQQLTITRPQAQRLRAHPSFSRIPL